MESRDRVGRGRWRLALAVLAAASVLAPVAAPAAGVKFLRMQSREDFMAGTLAGVSVDSLGTLELADRATRVADLEEPFLFSAAAHPRGWVVGTGNSGRVLLIDREGGTTTLFEAPEPEVFAVWADDDGTVYAGTSPNGKVYRLHEGLSEVFFDPGQTYIWDLVRNAAGSLLVATGTEGKLFGVDSKGHGEVLYDTEDTHVRTLEPLAGGGVLVGTAGRGLILEVGPDGAARTLHDAVEPEVVAFARHPDGSSYAAVLASEASLVDLARGRAAAEKEGPEVETKAGGEGDSAPVSVTQSAAAGELLGSRPSGFTGPRARILRLSESGRVEIVWSFEDETVYDLAWSRGRLWVATGQEGKVYSLRDRKMILEQDVGERQVVALMADQPGPAFATTNAAALYRVLAETVRSGTFTSPALDAGQVADFGVLRWRGEQPDGSELRFTVRTGLSSEPDLTWSSWSALQGGPEVALSDLAAGRYIQWRAEFSAANGTSPRLSQVDLSYRQVNLPPRVQEFEVLEPGKVIVPASFNPANQVFEPAHPNRDGIFTTLEPDRKPDDRRRKTLWKMGFRTLSWTADDPNDDPLSYSLSFRTLTGKVWLPMAEELKQSQYAFDASALPDGIYRFRLRVADRSDGDLTEALVAEEISEPVLIDHHPPVLSRVRRQGQRLIVTVTDSLNPLRRAEVSVDAEGWRQLSPRDGILDGLSEELSVEAPEDAVLVLLRVMDAAFNSTTFDLAREQP